MGLIPEDYQNGPLAAIRDANEDIDFRAGPAGLTSAYWLRRYGFNPTIVERAPSLLVGGYKIDVRGAALQVLRQMAVHDAVVAAHTDMQDAVLVDKEGNVVNRMSGDDLGIALAEISRSFAARCVRSLRIVSEMLSYFLATPFRGSPNFRTVHRFSSQRMVYATLIW